MNICSCGTIKGKSGNCPNPDCTAINSNALSVNLGRYNIWKSVGADCENWAIVPPHEVPDFIKNPEIMANLADGLGAQAPGQEEWYIATENKVV